MSDSDQTLKPLVFKDRYEVERELGRGGMSIVYLAHDRQLMNKPVVVKVLLDESQNDPYVRRKFQQEMEALVRIRHSGVVEALDSGETEGRQFLVMQYIEGQNLRQAIKQGPLGFERAAKILLQVGDALQAVHEKNVCHRDLTPENIMLQKAGRGEERVTLIDFGIAGIQNSAFATEKSSHLAGKFSYMSPEQIAGNPSAATDIFAMGICAYEILTGTKPFPPSLEHLVSAEKCKPRPPQDLRNGLPEPAGLAILQAISFAAQDRFPSASDFGDAVAKALTAIPEPMQSTHEESGQLEVGHILFTDLIGYSLLPTDRQRAYLKELQQIVRDSAAFKKASSRRDVITLPTGDGMALAFFGDPTQPAACAFEISKALKSLQHLKLRMGIHSGLVFKGADINANANVTGAGINMAQRVMDSGDAGHILVSEATASNLSQLSQWNPCLTDLGNRTVKHGVILHLYNLSNNEFGNSALPTAFAPVAAEVEGKAKPTAHFVDSPPSHSGNTIDVFKPKSTGISLQKRVALAEALDQASQSRLVTPNQPGYWVTIPEGTLTTGVDKQAYRSLPEGKHHIPTFKIGKFPVTVYEYNKYVEETGSQPGNWKEQKLHWGRPVTEVSWNNAVAYCNWAGCKLLTEQQWEYAAGGAKGRIYPWESGEEPNEHLANFFSNVGAPSPVGMFPDGSTPEGLLDMAGNVWEWTSSDFDNESKVLRGGSWNDYSTFLRGAYRGRYLPEDRFRLLRVSLRAGSFALILFPFSFSTTFSNPQVTNRAA